MREAQIEGYLVEQIHLLGGTAEKFVSVGKRGVPDRLVCWPANHWNGTHPVSNFGKWMPSRSQPMVEFIETKAPNGRLSAPQMRDHEKRRAMGFLVHLIWNMDLADKYLRSRGKL